MAIGGNGSSTAADSALAVAAPGATSGFTDEKVKPDEQAPNVKEDYRPTQTAAVPAVPKTGETKNDSDGADNVMSVKADTDTNVAADTNPLNVIFYGSPDAPVTIIEYASLTCPHCAAFAENVLPKLKENFIDTGKVRLVFRPYSLNGIDVMAGLLVTCLKPERRIAMIEALYKQRDNWIPYGASGDEQRTRVEESIRGYGRNAGLSTEAVDQCLENEQNQSWLQAVLAEGNKDGISGTPSFFINGTKYSAMPYEEWQAVIDPLLADAD